MLSGSQVMTVSASREDELRQLQAYTSYALNDTYNRINELEYQKTVLREQISTLDENLMNILVSVTLLEQKIESKEAEIEKTSKDLVKAEKARDKQYEDMKKRIQLVYEKGGDSAWFQMLMEAEDLSDFLNRAEYTEKLYKHDRECLEKYENVVTQVELLQKKHAQEMSQLEEMRNEYALQQEELQNQISNLEATSSNFDAEIAYAQEQAYQYAVLLEQQTAEIYALEAARIEAMQRAQIEAAQQAQLAQLAQLEQQQAAQAAATVADTAVQTPAEGTVYSQDIMYDAAGNVVGTISYDIYGNVLDAQTNPVVMTNPVQDTTQDVAVDAATAVAADTTYVEDYSDAGQITVADVPAITNAGEDAYGNVIVDSSTIVETPTVATNTGSAGSSVVDFATQFVGNPYVWGGTSLTNGADCSGFVQSVYSNFGVDLPRTTYDQINSGVEVSYADAQPGDLILYDGHVAIYMGDGQIVHAANEDQGIIISNNAAYDTILSVRRVI